jgi:hypothetical protein
MSDQEPIAVDGTLYIEIQRFLFREAALLDRREYDAWLALTTEDIQYCVTAAVSRDAGANAVDYSIIDENLVGLKSRIDQISNPKLTRAENPPSMTRFRAKFQRRPTCSPTAADRALPRVASTSPNDRTCCGSLVQIGGWRDAPYDSTTSCSSTARSARCSKVRNLPASRKVS